MEKKSCRSVQSLPKGVNFDKKNQDNNNGKQCTKTPNRREPSGNLPEATRKNILQRFKSDKRPKPRGRPDAVARSETSSLEEPQAELGSVFQRRSKRQSLNHLLNFTYAPRHGEQRQFGNRNLYAINGNYSFSVKKHKYIKEHFLQANCQFVVNMAGDYKQYLNNPDALVEWNYIEQINVQVSDYPSCPICLHAPAAAKITRCGHIYCWCCILHYLSLSDQPQRKCPICYENVCKEDLKSVVVIPHNTFNIGEIITLKLMKRKENSLTPYPAEENVIEGGSLMHFAQEQSVKMYCKLLLAQNSDILSIVNRENEELQHQLKHEDESEKCFIEEALLHLKKREFTVVNDLVKDMDIRKLPPRSPSGASSFDNPFRDYGSDSDGTASNQHDDSKFIYFYQACDGQHIYIHSINVKMLKHTYGSLEHAPNIITAKILAKEGDSITEDHRKYKYLAHLPVTCSFDTVEIELNVPIVTQETMDFFHVELEKRRKERIKKAEKEEQREKRINEEENRLNGKYPPSRISLENPQQFPGFAVEPTLENASGTSMDTDYTLPNSSNQGPSFAKMAAAIKTSSNPWPNLQTSAISIVSRTKLKELKVISGRRRHSSGHNNIEEEESSGHEFVPEPRSTFGDAIAQAIQKAAHSDPPKESPCEKHKKKKKIKPKILLSTSLGYSGN